MSAHVTTMHAHSPASYSLSLMIHGGLAAAIVLSAYFFKDITQPNSSIFTVVAVAGAGNNWNATEAPALGVPDAPVDVTFTPVPDPPRPAPPPDPVVETPPDPIAPVRPVPQNALVVPPPKKTATKQPTPAKTTPQTHISKAEYDRLYSVKNENAQFRKAPTKIASNTPTTPIKPVTPTPIRSPGQGLLAGVSGGTGSAPGAEGTALTAAERDQMEAYFNLLGERIKQAHEKPDSVSMELVTTVEYQVAADGTIGAVKILKSSGNRAFDESVLKAFRSVRPIGPRPDGRSGAKRADFRMKE